MCPWAVTSGSLQSEHGILLQGHSWLEWFPTGSYVVLQFVALLFPQLPGKAHLSGMQEVVLFLAWLTSVMTSTALASTARGAGHR